MAQARRALVTRRSLHTGVSPRELRVQPTTQTSIESKSEQPTTPPIDPTGRLGPTQCDTGPRFKFADCRLISARGIPRERNHGPQKCRQAHTHTTRAMVTLVSPREPLRDGAVTS